MALMPFKERPWIQDEWTPGARLESALFGKRSLGQQVLEIVISETDTVGSHLSNSHGQQHESGTPSKI
jgi:hypothetical protein